MRSFGVIGLFASLWLLGCSAPPRSDEVALSTESEGLVWADHARIPDRHLLAAPRATEPERTVVGPAHPKVSATFEEIDEGLWSLQDLSAVDMPAIDVDKGIVVVPQLEILQLSTIVGWWEVSWLDPSGNEESLALVDDSPREVRRRVREVNAKLRASQWRTMQRLAVELPTDDDFVDPDEPPGERRVQAITQHGELIVRIPGVRVLERHPLEHERRSLHRIYADRDSGTVLAIFMECTGEDCTCDPAFTAEVMRFDEATFTWIDRRPCSHCEPTDFGFNDGDPWG
jgi:hypothetical protein